MGSPARSPSTALAAPEGTRIQVKTSDGAGWGLSIAADGSWWIVLPTDPTPVTFTVDRLPVAGGPVDRSEGGQRQLALTASSLGVPLPSVLDFHGAAGSTTIGGQPAPDGAEIAAWVKGRMVSVTSAYRGAWVMSIAAGTTGIRFTVDGLPDAGRSLQLLTGWRSVLDHPCCAGARDRPRDDAVWRFIRQRADGPPEGACATRGADHGHLRRPRGGAHDDPGRRRLVDGSPRRDVRPPL